MRTLHADLEAAQKETSLKPVVAVTIADRIGGVRRPHPAPLYDGSEPAVRHDLAVTNANGVIIRIRKPAGAAPQWNRVTDPDTGNFGAWSGFFGGSGTNFARIASNDTPGSERAVYAWHDNGTVFRLFSNDEGGAWDGDFESFSVSNLAGLDIACLSDSAEFVCWLDGATLRGRRVFIGSVGSIFTSDLDLNSASAVRCERLGDDVLAVVTGTDTGDNPVVYATYFDASASAWADDASVRTIARADAGLGITYSQPFITTADADTRVCFREVYAGVSSYSRIMQASLAIGAPASSDRWSQPRIILDDPDGAGFAVAGDPHRGGTFWSRPSAVYRSPAVPDITIPQANIESLQVELAPLSGSMTLRLSDPTGAYTTMVRSGTHPLTPGAQVQVGLGYGTASGDRTSPLPYFWIDDLEVVVQDGRRSVLINAHDVHDLLDRWHPRDAQEYRASKSVFQVIDQLAARALVDYTTDGASPNLTTVLPDWFHDSAFVRWLIRTRPPGWQKAFYRDKTFKVRRGWAKAEGGPGIRYITRTIKGRPRWDVLERLLSPPVLLDLTPTSDGLSALSKLLSGVRDVSLGRTRSLVTRDIEPDDASSYEYGPSAHPIIRARYRRRAADYNHVWVWGGDSVVRSVYDIGEVHALGAERVTQVSDLAANTAGKADERAEAILRPSAVARREDVVEVAPNVGQELWDVVTISEELAGGEEEALRRVTALRILYDADDAEYTMWLTLGEP
ncbi:MAG: hypothetical protein GEU28_11210 [Dehalococcoidia bacterium]|nr:hypothetical protein [Dehalococcoidia bacterium]